jgi:hypothetical protein
MDPFCFSEQSGLQSLGREPRVPGLFLAIEVSSEEILPGGRVALYERCGRETEHEDR